MPKNKVKYIQKYESLLFVNVGYQEYVNVGYQE